MRASPSFTCVGCPWCSSGARCQKVIIDRARGWGKPIPFEVPGTKVYYPIPDWCPRADLVDLEAPR